MSDPYLHRIHSKARRHSIAASGAEVKNPRLFTNLFRTRSRSRNARSSSSSSKEEGSCPVSPLLGKQPAGESVRVIATALHPQVYYKTLSVKPRMTVYDVIVALVDRYADSMEDQNPDTFYLTEVQDTPQGSYSRVLENTDKIQDLKARWPDAKNFYFCICRKQFIPRPDQGIEEAEVVSPSDSFTDNIFSSMENNSTLLTEVMSKQTLFTSLSSPTVTNPRTTDHDGLVSSLPSTTFNSGRFRTSTSSLETEGTREVVHLSAKHHILQSGFSEGYSLSADNLSISLPGVHAILECPDSETETCSYDDLKMDSISSYVRRNSSPLHGFQATLKKVGSDSNVQQAKSRNTVFPVPNPEFSESKPAAPIRQRHYSYSGQQSQSYNTSGNPSGAMSSARSDGKLNQKMKRSISEGMDGIMKKVVGEKKHLELTASKAKTLDTDGGASKELGVAVRNLVCSPVVSIEKKFPEFVFTPGRESKETSESPASPGEGSESLEQSTAYQEDTARKLDLDEMQSTNSDIHDHQRNDNTSHELIATSIAQSSDHKMSHGQTDLEEEEMSSEHHQEVELPPYNHRRTSRTFPKVMFEASLVIRPRFHSTASVYPSFLKSSCHFSTEMNIFESLSTFFNSRIKDKSRSPLQTHSACSRKQSYTCVTTSIAEDSPSLISESRRTKLINLAAHAVLHKNKATTTTEIGPPRDEELVNKSVSEDTENDKQVQAAKDTALQETWTTSPLISPKRRARLIKLAASRFRKKRSKPESRRQSTKSDRPVIQKRSPLEDTPETEALELSTKDIDASAVYTSRITIPVQPYTYRETQSDLDSLINLLPTTPLEKSVKGVSFHRVSSTGEHSDQAITSETTTPSLRFHQYSEPHLYIPQSHSPSASRHLHSSHTQHVSFTSTDLETPSKIRPKSAHSNGPHHHGDRTSFSNQLQEYSRRDEHRPYKSLETLTFSERAVLYTFPSNKRPITILVRGAKSSLSLDNKHDSAADSMPPFNNTLKPASSQPVVTTQYVQVRADKRYKCWSTPL